MRCVRVFKESGVAEGARLLCEYGVYSLIEGSNPLSALCARSQLDSTSVYGTEGRRFESCRVRFFFHESQNSETYEHL